MKIQSVAAVISLALLIGAPSSAGATVPSELVGELGAVVEEAQGSDVGEARAWALRARALEGGREARELMLANVGNAELDVRLFAGLGLIELGRREGREAVATEVASSGAASRRRILERYVHHLAESDQVAILEAALGALTDDADIQDVLNYIAQQGQGAVFDLLENAREVPANQRTLYTAALISSGRPEAVEVAGRLASSTDADVRLMAVEVAAEVGGNAGRALLESLLDDSNAQVAGQAAFNLAPLGVTAAYPVLLDLAQTGSAAEQSAALEAIRDGQPSLLAFDDLHGMLTSSTDETLKRRIYEALGATGSDEAHQFLVTQLQSDVYEDRLPAIAGLGYTRREAAVPMLADVLLGGGGRELRTLAAEGLGHLEVAAASAPLLEALNRERGAEVIVAVIKALANSSSEDALWPLAFQLNSTDETIAMAALDALAQIGASSVAPQVESVVTSHRDPNVRWRAVLVLFSLDPEVGQIRLMQALDRPPDGFMSDIDELPEGARLEAYRRLARHNNADIRLLAYGRIIRLPGGGTDILRELADPSTPADIRQLAVGNLTANRDLQDLPLFTELADSSHRTMRAQALEAVVELAMPESEEFLRGQLESTDLVRRTMAVYGLWKLASQ